MAQFDVYRVRGDVLVVDCQSDLLSDLPTRFVAPLRPAQRGAPDRLVPAFEIDGRMLSMMTPLARSIARRDMEEVVASLAAEEFRIRAALDFLTTGY